VLSIHTYTQASEKLAFVYAAARFPNTNINDQRAGRLISSQEERLFSNEAVVVIPIENVTNVYYTVGVKRSVKTNKISRLAPRVAARTGCCERFCKKSGKLIRSNSNF
jgi:hypothetical protein